MDMFNFFSPKNPNNTVNCASNVSSKLEYTEFKDYYLFLFNCENALLTIKKSCNCFLSCVNTFSEQFQRDDSNLQYILDIAEPNSEEYKMLIRSKKTSNYLVTKFPEMVSNNLHESIYLEIDAFLLQLRELKDLVMKHNKLLMIINNYKSNLSNSENISSDEDLIAMNNTLSNYLIQFQDITQLLTLQRSERQSELKTKVTNIFSQFHQLKVKYFADTVDSLTNSIVDDISPIDINDDLVSHKIVEISAGHKQDVEFQINKGAFLHWRFNIKSNDIGYSVDFKNSKNTLNIIPYTKCDSTELYYEDSFLAQDSGRLVILFDNSYSIFRSKTLYIYTHNRQIESDDIEKLLNEDEGWNLLLPNPYLSFHSNEDTDESTTKINMVDGQTVNPANESVQTNTTTSTTNNQDTNPNTDLTNNINSNISINDNLNNIKNDRQNNISDKTLSENLNEADGLLPNQN